MLISNLSRCCFLSIFLALTILCGTSFSQAGTHFSSSGPSASAGLYSNDLQTSLVVQAFTERSTGQPAQTFLIMDFVSLGSTSATEVFGYTLIPNEDFAGDSTNHMSLRVDLSQLTGFTSCVTDHTNNNTVTCTNNPTGTINIVWQKPPSADVEQTYFFQKYRFRFGSVSGLMIGTFDNSNAVTIGSAFGLDLSGNGELGTSHQMQITVQRNQ